MFPRKARAVSVLTLSALAITGAALVVLGSLESTGVLGEATAIQPTISLSPVTAEEVATMSVVASPPLSLSFETAGILEKPITPYSDEEVAARNGVNPYTMQEISWWTGGGMPWSEGTTYLYGHTWTEPAVFNELKNAVVGDMFSITTAEGPVNYTVVEVFSLDKPAFGSDPRVTQDTPGRIVIATCDRTVDICPTCRTVDNVVVIGEQIT